MKAQPTFSLLDMIRAKAAGTWARIESKEFRAVSDQHERYGLPDSGYDCIPSTALTRATPLTAGNASNGGYLDGTALTGYLPALQPMTTLLRLGATQVSLETGSTVTPRGVSAIVATFQNGDEVTAPTQSLSTFGQLTFARKTVIANVSISKQLLLASNAEEDVKTELVRAIAAEIDKRGIQGSGTAGLPLGLTNNGSITTASGATLAYSSIVASMQSIASSNAVVAPVALGFLTTPVVAGLLKQRYYSAANLKIWEGGIPFGTIDGLPALSSTNVPAGVLLHADWSQLLVAQWADGLQIDVDPYTGFQNAVVTMRVTVAVDFQVATPLAFNILTGVT